jgi:hypothetical protein
MHWRSLRVFLPALFQLRASIPCMALRPNNEAHRVAAVVAIDTYFTSKRARSRPMKTVATDCR